MVKLSMKKNSLESRAKRSAKNRNLKKESKVKVTRSASAKKKKAVMQSAFSAYKKEPKDEPLQNARVQKRKHQNENQTEEDGQQSSVNSNVSIPKPTGKGRKRKQPSKKQRKVDRKQSSANTFTSTPCQPSEAELLNVSLELNDTSSSVNSEPVDFCDASYHETLAEQIDDSIEEDQNLSKLVPVPTPSTLHKDDLGLLNLTHDCSRVLLGIHGNFEGVKIFGQGEIKAVKGCGDILGHKLTSGAESEKFYAPITHSAMFVRPLCTSSVELFDSFLENIGTIQAGLDTEAFQEVKNLYEKFETIFLVTKLNKEDVVTFPGYQHLFHVRHHNGIIEHAINEDSCIVEAEKYFKEYPCYQATSDAVLEDLRFCKEDLTNQLPVILTCGGKNAGKSTFNRYLINKILQECTHVYYLECDIGQSEFTPSGLISLTCVSKPLLGPPFTHQSHPVFAVYYGDVSPASDPDRYVRCVQKVFEEMDRHGYPLIVNTMGWTTGLGQPLLIDTIRTIRPTHIVQLMSDRSSRNLPLLTGDYVADADGWICGGGVGIAPNHRLLPMDVEIHHTEVAVYKPSDLRQLAFLSYFKEVLAICLKRQSDGDITVLGGDMVSLCAVKPYAVRLSDVRLSVAHKTKIKRTHALAAFNAATVGLCVNFTDANEESSTYLGPAPVCQCLGLGVVRGVDPKREVLYVISDLGGEYIKQVNCLVLGAPSVPEILYQQKNKPGDGSAEVAPPYLLHERAMFRATGSNKFRVERNFFSGQQNAGPKARVTSSNSK